MHIGLCECSLQLARQWEGRPLALQIRAAIRAQLPHASADCGAGL